MSNNNAEPHPATAPDGDLETVFQRPHDGVTRTDLSRDIQIKILKNWDELLRARLRATDEGMAPPTGKTADEAATLAEVGAALKLIDPTLSTSDDVITTPTVGVGSHAGPNQS